MSVNDLRELSVQELQNKIVDLKKELMESRFALATSQIEDTSIFKKIKKEIGCTNFIEGNGTVPTKCLKSRRRQRRWIKDTCTPCTCTTAGFRIAGLNLSIRQSTQ